MLHEERKISKIVEELTVYFLAIGADDVSSEIKIGDGQATIFFRANYRPEYQERLEDVEKYLKEQKDDGVEDISWELAGSGDPGESSQLLLVGLMIDKAEVNVNDGVVELILSKKLYRD